MKHISFCALMLSLSTAFAQTDSDQPSGGTQAMELDKQTPHERMRLQPSPKDMLKDLGVFPVPAAGMQPEILLDRSPKRALRNAIGVTAGRLSAKKSGDWVLYVVILLGLIGLAILVLVLGLLSLKVTAIIFNICVFILVILYLYGII